MTKRLKILPTINGPSSGFRDDRAAILSARNIRSFSSTPFPYLRDVAGSDPATTSWPGHSAALRLHQTPLTLSHPSSDLVRRLCSVLGLFRLHATVPHQGRRLLLVTPETSPPAMTFHTAVPTGSAWSLPRLQLRIARTTATAALAAALIPVASGHGGHSTDKIPEGQTVSLDPIVWQTGGKHDARPC